MKYLLLIFLISCSPKLKVPDVRDKVEDDSGDLFSIRSFYDESDSTYIAQSMVGDTFSISDTSGVVAARADGKWTVINCERALEVIFKLDSLRCVNNRIENDMRERNQIRNDRKENEIKNL